MVSLHMENLFSHIPQSSFLPTFQRTLLSLLKNGISNLPMDNCKVDFRAITSMILNLFKYSLHCLCHKLNTDYQENRGKKLFKLSNIQLPLFKFSTLIFFEGKSFTVFAAKIKHIFIQGPSIIDLFTLLCEIILLLAKLRAFLL